MPDAGAREARLPTRPSFGNGSIQFCFPCIMHPVSCILRKSVAGCKLRQAFLISTLATRLHVCHILGFPLIQ